MPDFNECNHFDFLHAQQGWQCPICRRVYAPSTPMCWYCGGESITSTRTTGNPDWVKRDSDTTTSFENLEHKED